MHQFSLDLTIHAPISLVFTCFHEPEYLTEWFAPGACVVTQVMSNFKEGGKYRIKMQTPAGQEMTLVGEYITVLTNEKLVYSWAWADNEEDTVMTTVTLTFEEVANNEVSIHLEQGGFSNEEECLQHQHAWMSCLEKLAVFTQAHSKAAS